MTVEGRAMTMAVGSDSRLAFRVEEISGSDRARVLEGHTLLSDAMGAGAVEDLVSFWETVSRARDDAVVPKLVGALTDGQLIGFSIGAYLSNPHVGFIAYSAVKQAWRRRGVHTAVRERLIDLFNDEAGSEGLDYVVCELEEGDRLFRRYLSEWSAYVAPCKYEQPMTQGLSRRELRLVLQPLARRRPPSANEVTAIVAEIYQRLYRVPDVWKHPGFRRIVASLRDSQVAVPGAQG